MKNCPVCGGPGLAAGGFVQCKDASCDMPTVSEKIWNDFSDYKALRDFAMNAEVDRESIICEPYGDGWRVIHPRGVVVREWLMDAFITIARP